MATGKTEGDTRRAPGQGIIRPAVMGDSSPILALVNYYADQGEMLPRTPGDIYELIRDFVVMEEDGEVIGCGAMHIFWEDLAEIRSLALEPSQRGRGYGRQMVKHLLTEARRLGLKRVFALTYQVGFFQKLGFRIIEKETLPHKIWRDCINCPKFPNCDETAMIIHLDEE